MTRLSAAKTVSALRPEGLAGLRGSGAVFGACEAHKQTATGRSPAKNTRQIAA